MVTAGNCYRQVFKGQPDQVSQVRHAVGQQARNTPVADDVVLIASELASNAVLHSRSRGEIFADARERKLQEHDSAALDAATTIIQKRFTGEDALVEQLGFLAGKIREGVIDYTDHRVR